MIFSKKNKVPSWIAQCSVPAIKNRFFHIDLKGPKIPFEVFSSLLEQLARWGINGVVVEYEHRIPFLPLPQQFPSHERYTESQIKFLNQKAKSLGIEWIPLVQTFGHVEYLSRLKGTENLFEDEQYPAQLCPSRKEVKKYIEQVIDYICYLHPDSKYIHIGQDETRQLGSCNTCRKKVKTPADRIDLYLEHAKFVWEHVLRHGKTPMLWADMIIGSGRVDILNRIDKRIILVPWDYISTGKSSKFVIYKGFRPAKAQFRNKFVDPEPVMRFANPGEFFEDLDRKDTMKIGVDSNTGYPLSYAQLRVLVNANRDLWSACGLYMSADMQFHANYIRGVLNPAGMCDFLISRKGEGIIATLWARGHSFAPVNAPWTTVLYNLVQFARISYSGKTSPEDFRKSSEEIACELDMPAMYDNFWTLDDICWIISSPSAQDRITTIKNVLALLERKKVSGCFGEGLKMSLEAEYLQSRIRSVIDECRYWYSTRDEMPVPLKNSMKTKLSETQREIKKFKGPMKNYYLKWVGDRKSFSLWWENLFNLDLQIAREAIKKFR